MADETFQGRVAAESDELRARIDRLHAFMASEKFAALPMWEREAMWGQHAAMTAYRKCLLIRLDAWKLR